MKVCMLTTSFPRSEEDYSGIFILRLCKALASLGVSVEVVAPMGEEGYSETKIGECRVSRFSYFFPKKWQKLAYGPGGIPANLSRNPWLFFQVPLFVLAFLFKSYRRTAGTDLIHAHWIYSGLVAWILKKSRGIPFVITVRGEDALRSRRSGLARAISLWILRQADCVTTVNEEFKAWLIDQNFPSDRVLFIRNGVDLKSSKKGKSSGVDRLLYVGSLIPRKGVRYLVDALSILVSRGIEVRLTLIGDGEERAELERLVKEGGLATYVEFVGSRIPADIPAWMAQSDCLVLPSLWEGTPNVVLEAMACGLPVVASDLPGIREVVRDGMTGLLTKPQNAEDLAQKLLMLIRDRSLAEAMGKKGREAVTEMRLAWEQVAGRYREVYERVCAGSQGSSI